ncbi:MAG: hypothetical protein LBT44_01395 [Clostridiales bacterium]|jgi:hypothetical protein|nr:hypothetical protein [Clostridiales bacterium]
MNEMKNIHGFEDLSMDEAMLVNGGETIVWNLSQFGAVASVFVQQIAGLAGNLFASVGSFVTNALSAFSGFLLNLPDLAVNIAY